MMTRALHLPLAAIAAMALAAAARAEVTVEADTDRMGSDYSGYDLSSADPELCRKACDGDAQCKAYTYVKPGVQGPNARCYLKNAVPAPSPNACCVSGVKQAAAQRGAIGGQSVRQAPPARAVEPRSATQQAGQAASGSEMQIKRGVLAALAKPKDPGPLGKGQAKGSLYGKTSLPACNKGGAANAIFDVLDKVAEWFGGDVNMSAHCGNYEREVAAGVTLGAPSVAKPAWTYMGGAGDLMADAMLCLAKDIGEAPGGKITRKSSADIGGVGAAIEQTIGLADFNAAEKRAELWQQVRVCAPIIGCFDTERQHITAQVRQSLPAWPGGMVSGDYPVGNAYSINVAADWADMGFNAKTPPITVTTPYGSGSVQPEFQFSSSLYPVDTPFDYKQGVKLYLNHPQARAADSVLAQDTYGRSGVPFILNVTTKHKGPTPDCSGMPADYICVAPPGSDPAPAPFAWSSQLQFGARNGVDKSPWSPGANAKWPERPDLDRDVARSFLDRGPSARFKASAPVTFTPPGQEFLAMLGPAKSLINAGNSGLWITVTPVFSADYAAALGMMERDGRLSDCYLSGEFGQPCNLSEALLYQQTRAEARIELKASVRLKLDFTFEPPFYDPDIDITVPVTVPVAGPSTNWDPGKPGAGGDPYGNMARASLLAKTPGAPFAQMVKGLSGKTAGNIGQWTEQCLKTPPKEMASLPEPTHEPGSPDDLTPDLLPCNICVADSKQTQYKPFLVPYPGVTAKSYSKKWSCEWQENLGCYDMCTFHVGENGKAVFDVAVKSAVDVVGERCAKPAPPVVK